MKLEPLGDKILVSRDKPKTVTAGGVHLPDTAQKKSQIGKVEALGPGKRNDNGFLELPFLKEGDKVLMSSWAGTGVEGPDPKKEYLIASEADILAIVIE